MTLGMALNSGERTSTVFSRSVPGLPYAMVTAKEACTASLGVNLPIRMTTPDGWASTRFQPGGTLTLSEMHVSGRAPADVPLPAGEASVQDVTVNGQPAQYVEGRWTADGWVSGGHYQLHWQDAEGRMFDLVSNKLVLEALLAVAESLE